MGRFKSATENLGFVSKATNTIQKKEYNEETEQEEWTNKYIVDIDSVDVEEKEYSDDGSVSQADVVLDVKPSKMGQIILDASSYKEAKEKLNEKGYRYKDQMFTSEKVKQLDEQLKKLDCECKTGDILGLNQQYLYDYDSDNQVFSIRLDLDSETSEPLMAGLKFGSDSVEFVLIETLTDATATVEGVAFDESNGFLASAGGFGDDNVYVYDTSDFSLVETLEDSGSNVNGVDFDESNGFLASATRDENVYVYDTSDFSLIETLEDPTSTVRSVGFDESNGYLASGSDDEDVYVYDTSDFSLVETLTDATDNVYSVAFDSTNGYLASGSLNNNVYVYDTSDFSLVETLEDATNEVYSVAFDSTNGFLASASADDNVYVYDTSDFSLIETLTDATDSVFSVGFDSSNGFLASGSTDDNLYVYDTSDFSLIETLEDSTDAVESVGFDESNGFLASGSGDENVYVYDIQISGVFLNSPENGFTQANRFFNLEYEILSGDNSGTLELIVDGEVVETHSIDEDQEEIFTTTIEVDRDDVEKTWKAQLVDDSDSSVLLESDERTFTCRGIRVNTGGNTV